MYTAVGSNKLVVELQAATPRFLRSKRRLLTNTQLSSYRSWFPEKHIIVTNAKGFTCDKKLVVVY